MKLFKTSILVVTLLSLKVLAIPQKQKIVLRPLPFSVDNCSRLFPHEEGQWLSLSSQEAQIRFGSETYLLKKSVTGWLFQSLEDDGNRQRSFVLIFEVGGDTYIVSEKITENELEHTEQCAGQYWLMN